MIVQDNFLKKLRSAFDLNIYEVKIWTALLSKGVATAGELSDISSVPRSRSYDVLESLEKKGFVIMKLGKPIKYIAVKPEEIIKRVKDNINTRAETQVESLEKIRTESVFDELEQLYKQGISHVDAASLAGSLRGREGIYTQLQTMMENAKKQVTIVTTNKGVIRKANQFRRTFKKLAGQGVKIRIAAPLNDEALKACKEIKQYVQLKNLESMTARFVIVDDKEIMFMVNNDKNVHESYDTGIWANSPFFVSALSKMFNQAWNELK